MYCGIENLHKREISSMCWIMGHLGYFSNPHIFRFPQVAPPPEFRMNSNAGIQELMAAEQKASQIVAEARLGRGDRLKQAKSDASSVISTYRTEMEMEFQSSALNLGSSNTTTSAALQDQTKRDMEAMKGSYEGNGGKALQVLLSKCCEVDLTVSKARVRSAQKAQM